MVPIARNAIPNALYPQLAHPKGSGLDGYPPYNSCINVFTIHFHFLVEAALSVLQWRMGQTECVMLTTGV